ncbi:hypothetical protein LCGC14_2338050, partial [marine sediment metagenome]
MGKEVQACKVCGGPIRSDNKVGICVRNAECRKAKMRKWHVEHREECNAKSREWKKEHPEEVRDYNRKWYAENGKERLETLTLIRRLKGRMPQAKQRGCYGANYGGGGVVYCGISGCGKSIGWRWPKVIRNNKYGFLCTSHRGQWQRLKKLLEEKQRGNQE